MENFITSIKSIGNYVLELLFPSTCLGCGVKGQIFCSNCAVKSRRNEKETEGNIFAVFQYHDPLIKKAIWDLKYHNIPYLGQRLGEILYEELLEDISEIREYVKGNSILVLPVPISRNRNKFRGYNQAEKIARGFCNKDKAIFSLKKNIIKKKEGTTPQARITNRNRRLKNIKDSFELKNNKAIKNKTIIIIDDVTTTGGTINEITKLLKSAGAKKVVGFAVAH